jgi:hypothetical protein
MPLVKSLGELTIRTTIGHTIHVPASKPTYVPDSVLPFALAQGCVQCSEAGEVILQPAKTPKEHAVPDSVPQLSVQEQGDPLRRAAVIGVAIAKLYADNRPDDFTVADNRPKVNAVQRLVGFPVSGNELAGALELFQSTT